MKNNIMHSKEQLLGMTAAFVANIIFGFSFLFSKTALNYAHPLIILAIRFTIAFLVMSLLLTLGLVKVNYKDKKKTGLLMMCIAQPLCYFIFELYGIDLTSSALSGLIIGIVPVAVIIISAMFLSEKPTFLQVVCSIISLIGVGAVSILSDNGAPNHALGIFLLLGAVISAALFNILSRKESKNFSPFERTYFMFLIACIGFNLISVFSLKGKYIEEIKLASCHIEFWISIIYLAVVSSVAAFMLYNYSTSKISAVRSSSFSNIITVVSVFAGIIILKEDFSWLQLTLCIPIILGLLGVNYKKQ